MNNLYTKLNKEDMNEDECIYTIGDDILSQFYYGNFSSACNMMKEDCIRPSELITYLEEQVEEFGYETIEDLYNGHFSPSFWVALGSTIPN